MAYFALLFCCLRPEPGSHPPVAEAPSRAGSGLPAGAGSVAAWGVSGDTEATKFRAPILVACSIPSSTSLGASL